MRGRFIVFEGIDGCGKGTQLKLAHSYIWDLSKYIDILTTREPHRDFKEIRERMAKGTDAKQDAEWYARAFVADRKNHIQKYIQPDLDKGIHVLSDRYKLSTLAYQHTQGMDLGYLIEMHRGLLVPDLTIIFDCPADIAQQRRRFEGRAVTDVFENSLEFQEQLRQNYLKLPGILSGEKIIVIDSTPEPNVISEQVKTHLDELLK